MVFKVGIIKVPVSSLPEWTGHFIQHLALRLVTEHMLPQSVPSGRHLLP
jgi:hypothetical protein